MSELRGSVAMAGAKPELPLRKSSSFVRLNKNGRKRVGTGMKTLPEINRQPARLVMRFMDLSLPESPHWIPKAKPLMPCDWRHGNPSSLTGLKRRKRALILELTLSGKYVVMKGTKRISKTVRKSEIFLHSSPLGFLKKSESAPWFSGGRFGFCRIHRELIKSKKGQPKSGLQFSKN
jgi:hypothetical protein